MDKKHKSLKQVAPYLILVVTSLLLCIRAGYSFCFSDECFYFSTAGRFLQGDRLFVHEWFPTQMVSLMLMPFQRLYTLVIGSNDGIILYFRLLYVAFSLLISICIFNLLKPERGTLTPLACSLWYLLYVHLNIATLSYYTLSMGFFLLSMLLIKSFTQSKLQRHLVLSGVCLALSVLALPTLAIAWAGVMLLLLLLSFILPRGKAPLRKGMLLHLAGIIIPAIPVTLFLLATTGISGVIDNLVYILSDEEHVTSLVYPFKNFFISVFDVFGRPQVILMAALFVAAVIIRFVKIKEQSLYYVSITLSIFCLAAAVFFTYTAGRRTGFSGTIMLLTVLPLFGITDNTRKDISLLLTVFIGGLVFSMVYSYSSMCDLYVLSIGHNISAIACICFLQDYGRGLALCKPSNPVSPHSASSEKDQGHRPTDSILRYGISLIPALIAILLLGKTAFLRAVNVYRDDRPAMLTSLIEEGPAKGLYTTKEHREVYISVLRAIQENSIPGKKVFFSKLLPWGYLATDMECGSYTTWRVALDSERLQTYYDVHPEKRPDVVFILNEDVGSYETWGDVEADPIPNKNSTDSSVLYKELQSGSYIRKDYDRCMVYIKQ